MDGDSTNNDQGEGEYKKGDKNFWNGGDLAGITQQIDYIKDLGATGIWITPPVANQWRNPEKTGTGNHGYWASNFMEVDKHYGTLEDYRQLSSSLHKNDMYLIQDIVVNHLGDYYTYSGPYNPADVTQNFVLRNIPQPTQFPFNHNDANNPKDREMAIYHFTPNFHDHSDSIKRRNYQFADLDDLNTSNPFVRKTLRESYNFWIREVGVDGFRFDTPMMVEHEFWHDFLHADAPAPATGIEQYAQRLGKEKFLAFGETAMFSKPFDDQAIREAASYMGTLEKPEMNAILNFPLHNNLQRVFQQMRPTSMLTHHFTAMDQLFSHPSQYLNFIDNHDGSRFLSQTDRESFRQALFFIMTIPGIPVIYYGTEQEFLIPRQTMFKGGVGSPEQNHFKRQSTSFKFVQGLAELRKSLPALRRGQLKVLQDSPNGPGVFAYQLQYESESLVMLLNTADTEKIGSQIPINQPVGTLLSVVYSLSETKSEPVVDPSGHINLILPPKSGLVLKAVNVDKTTAKERQTIALAPLDVNTVSEEWMTVRGTSSNVDEAWIAIDGNTEHAIPCKIAENGAFTAKIPLRFLLNGRHYCNAYTSAANGENLVISERITFNLALPTIEKIRKSDPTGDDAGPTGQYNYPSHSSYTNQMDILETTVSQMGSNLKIDVRMGSITQIWLPPNDFDHLLLNIYIDLPKRKGTPILPFQNAYFPADGNWDYMVAASGFGNAIYSSETATATSPGKAGGPTPSITVDKEQQVISFTIAAESLGKPESLKGTKIYINTWGGSPANLRAMDPNPGLWTFSGASTDSPKIMDETDVVQLR